MRNKTGHNEQSAGFRSGKNRSVNRVDPAKRSTSTRTEAANKNISAQRASKLGKREKQYVASRASDSSEGLLDRYFKDVRPIEVLQSGVEGDLARKMEESHRDTWSYLLSKLQLFDRVAWTLEALEKNDENGDVRALLRLARDLRKSPNATKLKRFNALAQEVAFAFRLVDPELTLFAAAIDQLETELSRSKRRDRNGQQKVLSRANQLIIKEARRRAAVACRLRNEFISANLRLVIKIAKRYRNNSMPLVDLIQEGNIGLIEAVKRFDWRRGCRFSTYATWWIRHGICRALAERGRLVRIPLHVADAHRRVGRVRRDLSGRLGEPPTMEQVSEETGIDVDRIYALDVDLTPHELRLDHENSDGLRLAEVVGDPDATEPLDDVMHSEASGKALRLLDELEPVEADILRRRFGIGGRDPQTLREIAREYSLSRERIRQLEHKGLGLIRKRLMRRPLRVVPHQVAMAAG